MGEARDDGDEGQHLGGVTSASSRADELSLPPMSEHYPPCPSCGARMKVVMKAGRNSPRKGRYFVCSQRCSLGQSQRSHVAPECPWCFMPMRLHVGRVDEWQGVAIWWCSKHRFHQFQQEDPSPPSSPPLSPRRDTLTPRRRAPPSELVKSEAQGQRDAIYAEALRQTRAQQKVGTQRKDETPPKTSSRWKSKTQRKTKAQRKAEAFQKSRAQRKAKAERDAEVTRMAERRRGTVTRHKWNLPPGPKNPKRVLPPAEEPLGKRSVRPGSMYKSRDG